MGIAIRVCGSGRSVRSSWELAIITSTQPQELQPIESSRMEVQVVFDDGHMKNNEIDCGWTPTWPSGFQRCKMQIIRQSMIPRENSGPFAESVAFECSSIPAVPLTSTPLCS